MMKRNAAVAAPEAARALPVAGHHGSRLASFAPTSYNAETRSIEAVLSTGVAVNRSYFIEELAIDADAVDLSRVALGQVKLLDTHNQYEAAGVIGTVSNVRIENGQLLGTLNFGETDQARAIEGMVARGELSGVSIGYQVTIWEVTYTEPQAGPDVYRAAAWTLLEVSLVPVPADALAGVRSSAGPPSPGDQQQEEEDMLTRNNPGAPAAPAAIPAAEPAPTAPPVSAAPVRAAEAVPAPAPAAAPPAAAAPAAAPAVSRFSAVEAIDFVNQARDLGVEARASDLVRQNATGEVGVEAARAAIMQAAAEAQRAATAPTRAGPSASITRDGDETTRDAIVGAIVARALRSEVPDVSRQYMGWRLLEIAASRAGLDSRQTRDPLAILRAANTNSDFPLLLEAAANKILMARYTTANPTYQRFSARRDLTDFKVTKLLRVGDFPTLLPYQEDGEIKSGTINEGRETVILGSYGRIVRLSRQAIVNDDLGAFDSVFGSIGMVVARFENATAYAAKVVNSGNGPKLSDGVNFFNAGHGNLAGAGAAPDVTTLGAGRAAMRKQKDLDGNALNIAPGIILTGPDIETSVQQLLAPIQAQQVGNVNPFAGTLEHVVDANISGNAWELYGTPGYLAAYNYGYLADAPGPRVMTEQPFSVDGVAFRVTEDFYFGAVDYRAGYRNPGA